MKVVIVRREPGVAFSMDVYADNLVAELKTIRPEWAIAQVAPEPWWSGDKENLWHSGTGLRKYHERFWRHPRQVCHQEADLFHIIDHSNAHIAYWLKKTGKPVVVTCHDLVQFVYPEILRGQSRFPAFSMASWQFSVRGMLHARQVVAVSSNTAKDVHQMLGIESERIAVVPNGVDFQFRPLPVEEVEPLRQLYQRSPDEICLLNVGSTHQRKNILTILKVLKALRDRGLPVCLWRLGDKFMPDQQAFIEEFNLNQNILHFGVPDQKTLIQIYNAADVLLAPSLYEGFGLTVLEAMACGTPVITSNVSSLPEVAGDAAILVEPIDVQAMCTAVYQLQTNSAYRTSLISKGLVRAKQLTWNRAAQQVVSVYEQLMFRHSVGVSHEGVCGKANT